MKIVELFPKYIWKLVGAGAGARAGTGFGAEIYMTS
jgi:hypothetical protein